MLCFYTTAENRHGRDGLVEERAHLDLEDNSTIRTYPRPLTYSAISLGNSTVVPGKSRRCNLGSLSPRIRRCRLRAVGRYVMHLYTWIGQVDSWANLETMAATVFRRNRSSLRGCFSNASQFAVEW